MILLFFKLFKKYIKSFNKESNNENNNNENNNNIKQVMLIIYYMSFNLKKEFQNLMKILK